MTFPGLVRANNLSDVVDRERAWDNLGNGIISNVPDIYYGNVSLLLHGDGSNGSTTIVDSSLSPKTLTTAGNAQISTVQSKFGGSSIAFDGNGDFLTVDGSDISPAFDFADEDFTVEAWIYPVANSGLITLAAKRPAFAPQGWVIGDIEFSAHIGGAWRQSAITASRPVLGTWTHVALSRSANSFRLFHNGVQVGTTYVQSGAVQNLGQFVRIGIAGGTTEGPTNGYIDELRITKGVARYTSNFTPPVAPFYDPSNGNISNIIATIKGRDILALEGVRNTSTRDFVFIKGLTATAQPRITTAANNTASGVARRDLAMPKLAPTTSGNYFFSSGLTLSGVSTRINGTPALSIATSPFSGSTATAPLFFRELRPQANWRITEPMPTGTIATPELAIPFETNDFVFYMKAGQN